MARIGVLLDRRTAERRWSYGLNVFESYVTEILAYAGIPFQSLDDTAQLDAASFDVVIVALADEREETVTRLWSLAESGCALISYAGLNPLAAKLGCTPSEICDAGYAHFGSAFKKADAVRFLSAQPWRVRSADGGLLDEIGSLTQTEPEGAAIGSARQRFAIGKGTFERWAVDIPSTVVKLQQGTEPVFTDGVPAPDDSGPVNEGILKADDRVALHWDHDRLHTETGAPYFAYPYADYWRELLIGHLLGVCVEKGLTLPFLGYWPEGVEQVAMISHDSDSNRDEHATATLKLLEECGIHTTWCIIEPGYGAPVYEQVKQAGHELAFHYNALEAQNGKWERTEFARQLEWLKNAASLDTVYSNKNHYTRFEGWGELFSWCERGGVRSDQTRGPSKKGNVGFLFGTCHPYYPISWSNEQNRIYDVLEIGFLTQDLDLAPHWADSSVIVPFLERVRQVEGVAHFLFHQVHIHNSETVRAALHKVVQEARNRGYVFWTGKQVNDWHRTRRSIRIESVGDDGVVRLSEIEAPQGVVVWVPVTGAENPEAQDDIEIRFGVPCRIQKRRGVQEHGGDEDARAACD